LLAADRESIVKSPVELLRPKERASQNPEALVFRSSCTRFKNNNNIITCLTCVKKYDILILVSRSSEEGKEESVATVDRA
jgi:hypothetical protein